VNLAFYVMFLKMLIHTGATKGSQGRRSRLGLRCLS